MNFQILMSVMNLKTPLQKAELSNVKSNILLVNQSNIEQIDHIQNTPYEIAVINTKERGLSKSRNMAIKNSMAEICLLSDDDQIFVDNLEEIIINSFLKYPSADVISFQVEGLNGFFKQYGNRPKKINFISSLKISSVEIAFRSKSIKENGIQFNELFGSGSNHGMGEENIFLFDCLKKKMNIQYVPIKISDLYIGESTWFNGFTEKYFKDLGAIYYQMSPLFSYLLIIQFVLRKRNLFIDESSSLKAFKNMVNGRKEHKRYMKALKGR